ncbi:MAG TPA: tRNA dihydrouridine synthase DusB [Coriobacteriia bacterium]|nr:tRNA dihydrouridine synthase DusB [Coriobacteriia bacterium]
MRLNLFDKTVLLAPMAGVNDPVFRTICKRMGADLTYTEMVSAKGLEYGNKKTAEMLMFSTDETPVAVQLFGKEPDTLAEQAKSIEDRYGASIALIDINMGCPVRKVAGKGEGSALMKDPDLAAEILRSVVQSVSLPVTVKFRKGYELDDDTAVDFARMAEICGVAAVAVHGRTAKQFYTGTSDREIVARVKQAVRIPVIASGDVFTESDIRFYLDDCDADAVMVARGARGNPWIFAGKEPTVEQRVMIALEHTEGLAELLPARLPSMRKHIAWYFRGIPHVADIRRAVNDCITVDDYRRLLEGVLTWQ